MTNIFRFNSSDVKKLLARYYNLDVGESFLNCARNQLGNSFLEQTGIEMSDGVWLGWEKEYPIHYREGDISTMNAQLNLWYGQVQVKIAWKFNTESKYLISSF